MNNFDIEGETYDNLHPSLQNTGERQRDVDLHQSSSSQDQHLNNNKIYDTFDVLNCALATGFKILSIILYLILKLVMKSYLGTFMLTIIGLSIDFWVTKNLTGRKLVGLKWWSQISESGTEQWVFESRSSLRQPHFLNQKIFWISQLTFIVFWIVNLIVNLFTLSLFWISLSLFCVGLSFINFVCFFKCRGEHQNKAAAWANKMGINKIL